MFTGASSSYICSDVITKLNLKPTRKEQKNIEQMYGSMRKMVEIYKVNIESNIGNSFTLEIDCINADKDVLTYLPNPNIAAVKAQQPRFRRLSFCDEATTLNIFLTMLCWESETISG